MQFIRYVYYNINRVMDFCEGKAEFLSQLHLSTIKEQHQVVRPSDFIFKSDSGNFLVKSSESFFMNFSADEKFNLSNLNYPCTILV